VRPALDKLGYNSEEIECIIAHIDSFDTIEDVTDSDGSIITSGLKPEHLPIFDCAFKPYKGERSLGYMGHLRMMAAAQPFLSGAISKTVNMPENATVDEIMNTYVEGWRLGLKAIAIYRDGSKRSAPLNTRKTKDMGGSAENGPSDRELLTGRIVELDEEISKLRCQLNQPVRHRMSDTRMSLTHKFEIAGHEGYITVGLYEDGQPGELFLTMAKEGSTISGFADAFAQAISYALQYGVPLQDLVDKFSHVRFEPSGMTRNPDVRFAKSIVDYIFRWMAAKFLSPEAQFRAGVNNRDEVVVTTPEQLPLAVAETAKAAAAGKPSSFAAIQNQEDAPPCSTCGSIMVRSGACYKCSNCGTTSGCA
jgi:ribonucleoside-diphosphate reductase alpha chain